MVASGHDLLGVRTARPGAPPDAPNYCGWIIGRRVEVGVAVGIPGALVGIDGGIDRHAGAQQVLPRDVLRHANADRQPLHDLGEVAGGVVRRQQREHRAGRGRDAVDDAGELAMAVGIDRDRHRLARTDPLELRLLEIGVDEDVVERHHIAEPLPDHDVVAGVDQAVGEGAVDRRAHRGEVEVALGLGERGLQFRKLGAGLGLLRLGDLDIVARRVIGRLRRLHRRDALVAPGFGHLEGRARGKSLGAQRLLAIEIEAGALQAGFRGSELRLGLLDRAFQRGDLAADAVDGGLLGRDPGARGIHRDAIVAVVDPEDHVAGLHHGIVAGKDRRDVARHPGAERGVVGAHIGVVGRDEKASDQKIMHAIGSRRRARAARRRPIRTSLRLPDFGAARLAAAAGAAARLVDGRLVVRRLGGAARDDVFGEMRAKRLGRDRGSVARGVIRLPYPAPDEGCGRPGLSLRPSRPPHCNIAMPGAAKIGLAASPASN